jgi:hypothetical protein
VAKRVQTGCPNCKRCTNSAAGEGGRKAGRAMAAMMTGGLSEGARLATGNCRACGHKMSLHAQVIATSTPAPSPASAGSPAVPAWSPDPASDRALANDLDEKAAKEQAKAEEWEAIAASCDESKFRGRVQAKNARVAAQRFRNEEAKTRQRAANLRSSPLTDAPAPVAPSAPETATDLTEQLARLAELKASGLLSDEEFASAKGRLLG